jgi:putative salt-induced outer membrane protein YdiY
MNCTNRGKLKFFISLFLLCGLTVYPVFCQEAQEKKKESDEKEIKYSSSTSFSLLLTSGNKKDFNFSFDTEQNLHFYKNRLNLKGNIIFTQSNGKKKSGIYYSHLKYDRKINSHTYLLGLLRIERNKSAGYNFRFAASAGVGYTLLKKKKVEIAVEGAVGWSSENDVQKIPGQPTGDENFTEETTVSNSFVSSIYSAKLVYDITPSARLTQEEVLFLNMGHLNEYRLNSYSSISASISRYFALKTSLQINYDSHPVAGYKNIDLFLLSSLVIKI